jgi:prefoldin alpha subunit
LDDEVEHLTASFSQLREAQLKFKECFDSVTSGLSADHGKEVNSIHAKMIKLITLATGILIPLTNSLYCRGEYLPQARVLIDVGTGYFVDKDRASAQSFYEGKVKALDASLRDLEGILQQKLSSSQSVDSVLRRKLQAQGKSA